MFYWSCTYFRDNYSEFVCVTKGDIISMWNYCIIYILINVSNYFIKENLMFSTSKFK